MSDGLRAFELPNGNFETVGGVLFEPLRDRDRGCFQYGRHIELIEPELGQPRTFGDESSRTRIVAILAEPVLKRARKHSGRKHGDTEEENKTARLGGEFHSVLLV